MVLSQRLAVLAGFTVALGSTALGQAPSPLPAYRARVLGVFDSQSGMPIEGAEVLDMSSKSSARTTATGTIALVFLPDGGGIVRIQKIGYEPVTQVVEISPDDTVPVTVLMRAAVTLPTVVTKDSAPHWISPALRAFEERRQTGMGRYITAAQLRKNDGRTMTNLIRELGIKVNCTKTFPIQCFATSTRAVSCSFETYLDGVRINKSDLDRRDLERILVTEMGGVEVYASPATIPPLYNATGSACGVLLFWTRER